MSDPAFVFRVLASVAAVLVIPLSAQTSPPPLCFAFNDTVPSPAPNYPEVNVECGYGGLTIHFAAPASSTIDRIDVYSNIPTFNGFLADLFATTAIGASPTGPALAQYAAGGGPFPGPIGWKALTSSSSALVSSGGTYALRLRSWAAFAPVGYCPGGGPLCTSVAYDTAGSMLPYTYQSTCGGSLAPSGVIPAKLRFRGTSCGPGPPASLTSLGGGCGAINVPSSSGIYVPAPFQAPPVLGSTWFLLVSGPIGETACLFWSGTGNLSGTPISAASSCLSYLDTQSLQSLALQGVEPLITEILVTGTTTWGFTLPSSPALAGLGIAIQAVVVGPSGTIPLGAGFVCQTTNALLLTLGY